MSGVIVSATGLVSFSIPYLTSFECELSYISCTPAGGVVPFWSGLLIVPIGIAMVGLSLWGRISSSHDAMATHKDNDAETLHGV